MVLDFEIVLDYNITALLNKGGENQ